MIALVALMLNGFNEAAPQPAQAVIKVEDAKKKAEDKNELQNKPNGVAIPISELKDSK